MSHRDRIKKKMMTWQLAALVVGVGAVGLLFAPLDSLLSPPAYAGPKSTGVEGSNSSGGAPVPAGLLELAIESMKKIGGTRAVAPIDETPTTEVVADQTQTAPPPPQSGAGRWVYKGYMAGGGLVQAWIQLADSQQIMLAQGGERDGMKLKKIAPDHIMVEQGGMEQRIDLAARTTGLSNDPPKRATAARPTAAMIAAERQKAAMRGAIAPGGKGAGQNTELADKYGRDLGAMGPEKREAVVKMLTEPGISAEQRQMMFKEIGLPMDLPVEDRLEFLRQNGISEDTDPRLYEMVKEGVKQ